MNRISFVLICVSIFAPVCITTSCVSNKEFKKIVNQRDSLQMESAASSKKIENLMSYLDSLTCTLDSITMRENILRFNVDQEGHRLSKHQIMTNIDDLNNLIEEQKVRIEGLSRELAEAKDSTSSMSKLVRYFRGVIAEKKEEIENLKKNIEAKERQIRQLKQDNDALAQNNAVLASDNENLKMTIENNEMALNAQNMQINSAKVRIANKKVLIREKTIRQTLSGPRLNTSSLDYSLFEDVNKREFNNVIIPGSKVKIISEMPESSYDIQKCDGGSILYIWNIDLFWSMTNCLVISYE